MKRIFRWGGVAWRKWWIKWPAICLAIPIGIFCVYLLLFNRFTMMRDEDFVERWEPVAGSFEVDEIVEELSPDEDLLQDPEFKKLIKRRKYRWWVHDFLKSELDEETRYLYSLDRELATNTINLREWFGGGEGMSEVQIAHAALEQLEKNGDDIILMERLLDRYSRMYQPYLSDRQFDDPSVISLLSIGRVFKERAILRAYVGNLDGILKDLSSLQRLETLASSDTSLTGFLVDAAIRFERFETLRMVVTIAELDANQLDLLSPFAKADNPSGRLSLAVKNSFAEIRAIVYQHLEEENKDRPSRLDYLTTTSQKTQKYLPDSFPLAVAHEAYAFLFEQIIFPKGEMNTHFVLAQQEAAKTVIQSRKRSFFSSFREKCVEGEVMIMLRQIDRVFESQALQRMAETALACERYGLDKGEYPNTLGQLVPLYLPTVPKDPFTVSQNLRYRSSPKGFILYSLGQNRTDNGGMLRTSENYDECDLVWQSYFD